MENYKSSKRGAEIDQGVEYVNDVLPGVLDSKQNKNDNNLTTTDKTVVGAINEVKVDIDDIDTDLQGVNSRVSGVESKIPEQATSENKLADKAFVNSSIATETAHYISDTDNQPFTSENDLPTANVTNNDYAFVTGTDSDGNTFYDRYKATVSGNVVTWAKEYRLNNSSFTAAQWATITSGITVALVTKLSNIDLSQYYTKSQTDNLLNAKYEKPSAGIPKTDLSSEVQASLDLAGTAIQDISGKQDALVSGTNIKTINGESVLGSGDLSTGKWKLLGETSDEASYWTNRNGVNIRPSETTFFTNSKYTKLKLSFDLIPSSAYTNLAAPLRAHFQGNNGTTLGYRLFQASSLIKRRTDSSHFYGEIILFRNAISPDVFSGLVFNANNGELVNAYMFQNNGYFENAQTAEKIDAIFLDCMNATNLNFEVGTKIKLYALEE